SGRCRTLPTNGLPLTATASRERRRTASRILSLVDVLMLVGRWAATSSVPCVSVSGLSKPSPGQRQQGAMYRYGLGLRWSADWRPLRLPRPRDRNADEGTPWLRHLTSGALRRAGFETFYPAR